jgi:hypothetical protein
MQKPSYREASLGFLYPEIASSWHPTKNGNISPSDLLLHSDFRAWWLCNQDHVANSYQRPN